VILLYISSSNVNSNYCCDQSMLTTSVLILSGEGPLHCIVLPFVVHDVSSNIDPYHLLVRSVYNDVSQ